jgi:apolipoprotein N-acyltransferase
MRTYRYRSYLAASLAGLGIAFSVLHTVFLLAWVCMVPLFMCVESGSPRRTARMGFITGVVISLCGFSWMIPGAETFTGSSIWYGIAVFVLCTMVFSAYWAGLLYVFAWMKPTPGRWAALLAASLWVCAEAGLACAAREMPWFLFHTGNALAGNLYAIQPFSMTGVHGGTFVVVGVNYGFAHCIVHKQWKRLVWPAAGVAVYLGLGWSLLSAFETTAPAPTPLARLSILAENIPPDVQWDSASGNKWVARLLDLDRQAVAEKPDMTLWSESAIPWTYRPDDDLVNEIGRISARTGITQVLGMNTAFSEGVVYNSAYVLRPDGSVAGRYDKRVLLLGIEQPWNGWLIPFFSSGGYAVHPGTRDTLLPTPFGPAGILICNESAIPAEAADKVRHGARFLLNLSNDGWFSDTYLVSLHFYNVRLRAVETRKDIAVNSNNGISGLVQASGRIASARKDDAPFVSNVTIRPNDDVTIAAHCPWLPVALCGLYLLCCVLLPYYKHPN